ncbi:MAG: hypothetical protein HYS98_00675 [Deltaproteobacteria bacterium]|nr:hypothetical protein [Deltaproteobacteria bacterium]
MFLVFLVPLLMLFLLAFYVCDMSSRHIQVQKVADEATKRATRIQIKGLQLLSSTNRWLLTLHAALRSLQALALSGGISKAASILIEEKLKAAIQRLAKFQDESIPFFLASSQLPAWKLKNQFRIDLFIMNPLKPHYYIERTKIGLLPGPYELSSDFQNKQNMQISMVSYYKNNLEQTLLPAKKHHIKKTSKIQIVGENLYNSTFKMKFLL